MNITSNTHDLADASPIDGVFQTVVAVDRPTCDIFKNAQPSSADKR